jgi:Uma2 family endonuclease
LPLLALDGMPDWWYVPTRSAALKPMSLEAFLDWESQQEFKYEFDGFQPVGSWAHSRIQFNLLGLLLMRYVAIVVMGMAAT